MSDGYTRSASSAAAGSKRAKHATSKSSPISLTPVMLTQPVWTVCRAAARLSSAWSVVGAGKGLPLVDGDARSMSVLSTMKTDSTRMVSTQRLDWIAKACHGTRTTSMSMGMELQTGNTEKMAMMTAASVSGIYNAVRFLANKADRPRRLQCGWVRPRRLQLGWQRCRGLR